LKTFKGLTTKETNDYLLSTGKAIKGIIKPLSPMEVMQYIDKMLDAGLTKKEIIELSPFKKDMYTNHYVRFKKIIPEVQALADWGATTISTLGFTSVWHYYRFTEADQKFLYKKALKHRLTRDQIKEIAQFYERGFGSVKECYEEVLTWKPVTVTYSLFIGKIRNRNLIKKLEDIKQTKKDLLLSESIKNIFKIQEIPDSRLLKDKYTIIFKPSEESLYKEIKNKDVDKMISDYLDKKI